jgi:hypothetical protein
MTDRILGEKGTKRRRRFILGPLFLAAASLVLLIGSAGAANQGGFEIDAGLPTPTTNALYSGNLAGVDWAGTNTTSTNGVFAATGTTLASPGGSNCYGQNVYRGTAAGTASFICDGNSDSRLRAFTEQNIVSPSGKSPDASWPIKPGNVRPKNDFSHAYVYARTAHSPCNPDANSQDPILYLGGHVGDNEGDHFWGFEFDKNAPTNFSQLTANAGDSFTLGFNRSIGDILVSITVPGSAGSPILLEIFRVTGFNADGSAQFTLAGTQSGCPANAPQGLSELATNVTNDVTAPPWPVPACDPTADDSANQCRLASGTGTGDHLLPTRDFAEASVDLYAFGINPCFSNVIFTSRSAHVLEGADVQDVGGANFPLCGAKSGTKFKDVNANGVRDTGDSALSGWTVKLYKDQNSSHTLDAADDNDAVTAGIQAFQSATTVADGTYSFPALGNGDYIVCEVNQATWFESRPFAGLTGLPTGESVTGSCPTGNITGAGGYTLATYGYAFHMSGPDLPGNDFGNYQKATISGTKFKDALNDGATPFERTLGGWTIDVYDSGGTLVSTKTTAAADGTYTSDPLAPGTYLVCESTTGQTGWQESYPTGSTTGSADCSAKTGHAARGWTVTLTSGTNAIGKDFANTPQSTITVNFNPLATLPDTGSPAATKATNITCTHGGTSVAPAYVAGSNTLTTNTLTTDKSTVTCVITFSDP